MSSSLLLLGRNKFPAQFSAAELGSGGPTCSPTIDLVAFIPEASNGEWVYVWRTNGQLVHKTNLRYHQQAHAICWKPDGQFLAIGWDDGFVRLVGLENSKAAHQIMITDEDDVLISHISWAKNHTRKSTKYKTWSGAGLLSGDLKPGQITNKPDLPRALTFLEVDTALPKISPLPMDGGSGEDMFVFTTKSSLDFVFPPLKQEQDDIVDVLISGTTDGKIHLTVYDSFVVGTFDYHPPESLGISCPLNLSHHAFQPEVPTHALVFKPTSPDENFVVLAPLDLHFITSSPIDLSLLAAKTTTLQNLIRYLKQTQIHIFQRWQSTRDLPNRFLRPVREDLDSAKSGPKDIVASLYHSVLTGHMFPVVREWLVDIVAERGHKRWNKAVTEGLVAVRGLVHENLLPVLDRTAIVLSRLLGLARFHDDPEKIGFSEAQICQLLEIISCLSLAGNKILLIVMEEIEMFAAFSSWMRFEIDKQTSSSSDDLLEKEAQMDHARILAYIQKYLAASPMSVFLEQAPRPDYDLARATALQGQDLLDLLDATLQQREAGGSYVEGLPHVKFLVEFLSDQANVVFKNIAQAGKRMVRFGPSTKIELDGPISRIDVKIVTPSSKDATRTSIFSAFISERRPDEIYIFSTFLSSENGFAVSATTTSTGISLGGGRVMDLKFLDDKTLLLVWSQESEPPLLLHLPYRSEELTYVPQTPGPPPLPHNLIPSQVLGVFEGVRFTGLAANDGFIPYSMEIRESCESRGKVPTRICLLGKDRLEYRVYALPENQRLEDDA
ncbi:hypothetical protein MKZ38_006536 [Zalerion maritima]|uniref:Anaphase-promoting complex subunit 4 n=1 Tax=Zalerion maritima TaxID=339359 RepID=A0AAD5WW61_9PEZI|nr:hypothetical protein MKZ38_006536 [Zalerion maritima]